MTRILLLILIALLSACNAKLTVRVDTLNPQYVQDEIVRNGAFTVCQMALSETPGSIDSEIAELTQKLVEHHALVANAYRCESDDLDDTQRAALAQLSEDAQITSAEAVNFYGLDDYRQQRLQRMDAVQRIVAAMPPNLGSPCQTDRQDLFAALGARRALIADQADLLAQQLSRLKEHAQSTMSDCDGASEAADKTTTAVAELTQSAAQIDKRARSVIGGNGSALGSSSFAYLVSSAPEPEWKVNFNRAEGSGSMGNLDVAIILNETADFSVKGLRFDASKVAEVASKVTSQALNLAVEMISGGARVQVPAPAGSSPSALAQSSSALAAAQQQLAVSDALRLSRQRALYDLADTLIASYGIVGAANLQTTSDAIRARLDAQLPLLKLTVPTQP